MSGRDLRLPTAGDLRAAEARYLSSHLVDDVSGARAAWPHDLPLKVSGLSGKTLAANLVDFSEWVRETRALADEASCEVVTASRRIGRTTQPIPAAIRVPSAVASASLAHMRPSVVSRLEGQREAILEAFPSTPPETMSALLRTARGWDANRFASALVAAVWLRDNPPEAGALSRRVAIPTVNAKFLDRASNVEFIELCIGSPLEVRRPHLCRFEWRSLDPADVEGGTSYRLWVEGQPTCGAPTGPVLVVENQDAFDTLPPLPGVAAVFGEGKRITGSVIPDFVRAADRLLYWGDIDADGYAILDAFRSSCPQATSVMMDPPTLSAFGYLGTNDAARGQDLSTRARRDLPHLTPGEEEVYLEQTSRDPSVPRRLEQERLPADYVLDRLRAALGYSPTQMSTGRHQGDAM